jgi:hypothetical protein
VRRTAFKGVLLAEAKALEILDIAMDSDFTAWLLYSYVSEVIEFSESRG